MPYKSHIYIYIYIFYYTMYTETISNILCKVIIYPEFGSFQGFHCQVFWPTGPWVRLPRSTSPKTLDPKGLGSQNMSVSFYVHGFCSLVLPKFQTFGRAAHCRKQPPLPLSLNAECWCISCCISGLPRSLKCKAWPYNESSRR